MFLNNQQVIEEIKRGIKKFLETNDNANMTTQNLQGALKALLRGKFIAIQSYLKKQEKTSNRQPNFTPKTTGKRRRTTTTKNQQTEIIKIQAEINEKKIKETIVKINKTISWFFEKINKIDRPLARLIKKKKKEREREKEELNQQNQK